MKGRKIQNYIIGDKIGEGGMGTVHFATRVLPTERKFVVKILNSNLALNPHIQDRFQNEAIILDQLQHPNIVRLVDFFMEGNESFMIMDYAEGIPLDEIIKKNGKIPEAQAKDLLRQIADGIAHAHSKGIAHRDIKPANFIVSTDNQVKILDFGIAKILAEESRNLTKTGMRMGSLYFMSPEQVRGDKDISHRTDIYSLGLMYYVMLTGEYPLENLTSEYIIYDTIVNKDFIDMNKLVGISDLSKNIIKKCLQRNPQDRFATALEISKLITENEHITVSNNSSNNLFSASVLQEENRLEIPKNEPNTAKWEKVKNITPSNMPNNSPDNSSSISSEEQPKSSIFGTKMLVGVLVLFVIGFAVYSSGLFDHLLNKYTNKTDETNTESELARNYPDKYVIAAGLNLRSNASKSGNILHTITYGEKVGVIERVGEWSKVLYKGTEGYVFSAYLGEEMKPLYQIQVQKATFYGEPNIYTKTGSYLVYGDFVVIERSQAGFAYVNFNGTTGWLVESDLVRVK